MNTYMITYDLNTPGKDYSSLISRIKSYSYSKICESAWIVKSNGDTLQVRDDIASVLDKNDRLFVAKLTGQAAWSNCIDLSENVKRILN